TGQRPQQKDGSKPIYCETASVRLEPQVTNSEPRTSHRIAPEDASPPGAGGAAPSRLQSVPAAPRHHAEDPLGLQFAENLGNGHMSSHGSGTPDGMGQPPD